MYISKWIAKIKKKRCNNGPRRPYSSPVSDLEDEKQAPAEDGENMYNKLKQSSYNNNN